MKTIYLLLLVLVLAGIGLAVSGKLSILNPGPEGVNVVVYGVHYRNAWANASDYSNWSHDGWSASINEKSVYVKIDKYTSGIEDHDYYVFLDENPTDIEVRFSRPIITRIGDTVEYVSTKKYENGTIAYIVRRARIIDAEFNVELRSVPGTGYGGVEHLDVWFTVEGVSWQKYIEAPSTINTSYTLMEKEGVIIPLMAYADEVEPFAWVTEDGTVKTWYPDDTAKDNVDVFPSARGDVLGLRSEPSYSYNIEQPPDIPDDLKDFVSKWSPDWRLNRERWYTYISIRYMEPHLTFNWFGQLDKVYYPSTTMRIHVIALAVGEFKYLWTQEQAEEHGYGWDWLGSTKIDLPSLDDLLENPWFWFGLGAILFIIILIIVLGAGGSALLSGVVAGVIARKSSKK